MTSLPRLSNDEQFRLMLAARDGRLVLHTTTGRYAMSDGGTKPKPADRRSLARRGLIKLRDFDPPVMIGGQWCQKFMLTDVGVSVLAAAVGD